MSNSIDNVKACLSDWWLDWGKSPPRTYAAEFKVRKLMGDGACPFESVNVGRMPLLLSELLPPWPSALLGRGTSPGP